MTPSLSTALAAIRRDCEHQIELGEDKRVPEGPWFVAADNAEDCPNHAHSGLALIETGRSMDWYPARLCEWPTATLIAHSRTFCPVFARAVIRLMDALEGQLHGQPHVPQKGCARCQCEVALQSLADSWPKEAR